MFALPNGCQYLGYTAEHVMSRVENLATHSGGWGSDSGVMEHAQHLAYFVRCIATNLTNAQARDIRDQIIRHVKEPLEGYPPTTIQHPDCWLLNKPRF